MIDYTWNGTIGEEIRALYQKNGWTAYLQDWEKTLHGISESSTLFAYDKQKLVGLIRGVTDSNTILYVQDLLVLPEYQNLGIGGELVKRFLTQFASVGQVILTAENTKQAFSFYHKQGFQKMSTQYGQVFVRDNR